MGDRAADDQGATAADLAEMARLTTEALRAGALGFSTSRTPLHKDNAGNLVPGTFAPTDELFAIAEAIADAGHGVFQCALHHPDVPESADWLRQVAKITGQPVIFNLNQPDEHPDLWREELDILEAAQAEGLDLLAQVAGRPVGILECWDGTANPFVPRPAAWELAELSRNDRLAALKRPETRQALCDSEPIELSRFETFVTSGWHKMYPFDGETDYEPEQSQSVAAIAERTGRRPVEIAYDQLMADDGNGLLYFPLFNYANGDLDHLWELHQHPYTRMGLADAGAHCGAICDGGMPTFMVSFWTRDRTAGRTPSPRAHRFPPDETDGRALRPAGSRGGGSRLPSRSQCDRLRQPDLRSAPHGVGSADQRSTVRAEGQGIPLFALRRHRDGAGRHLHRRSSGKARARPPAGTDALTTAVARAASVGRSVPG